VLQIFQQLAIGNWQLAKVAHPDIPANCELLFANCSIWIQQNFTRLACPQPVHAFAEIGHRHAICDH
jgi:hypothetical protein